METSQPESSAENDWRVAGQPRGTPFPVHLDGQVVQAYPGETVAGMLWRLRQPICRSTEHLGEARSYFCGMGTCFECLVTVDGVWGVRACYTQVRSNMQIERQPTRRILRRQGDGAA